MIDFKNIHLGINFDNMESEKNITKQAHEKYLEKQRKDFERDKIDIQNRIDRMINDTEIIKHEFIFSKKFEKQFALQQTIDLHYYKQYLIELKSKIIAENIPKSFGEITEY